MSSTGNRSNPNQTRLQGKHEPTPDDSNRSDVAKALDAGSKSPGGRPPSTGGSQQETREHNKTNDQGQTGHKPQKHSPAEEKH